MTQDNASQPFRGFPRPNGTQVPDILFDQLLPDLSGAELKVLLYVIRKTYGWGKDSDNISLSQMLGGIRKRDGTVVDRGVGLTKKTLLAAINSLEERNFILTERRRSPQKGDEPTTYKLNVIAQGTQEKSTPPVGEKLHQGGGGEITPGPWGKNSPTQLTPLHPTLIQPTEESTKSQSHPVLDSYPSNIRKGHAKKTDAADGSRSPTPSTPSDRSLNVSSDPANGATDAHVQREPFPSPAMTAELPRLPGAPPAPQGFARPGDLLAARYQPPPVSTEPVSPVAGRGRFPANPGYSEEDRLRIGAYVKDYSWKLGDRAPLRATISRAMNLYVQAHCDPQTFCDLLYQAYRMTQEQGTIRGSKTAYWFSVVADLCGLKAVSDAPPPQRGRGRGREAADTLQRASRRRPTIAGEYVPVVAGSSEGTTPERANSAPGFDSAGGGAPTGSIPHQGRSTPRKPRSGATADTSGPREEGAQE